MSGAKPHKMIFHPSTITEAHFGNSQGTISIKGSHCRYPSWFAFILCVWPLGSEHTERQCIELFSWKYINFYVQHGKGPGANSF